jgi:RNA polymerase sigma-70 factor (ECF subfamily)
MKKQHDPDRLIQAILHDTDVKMVESMYYDLRADFVAHFHKLGCTDADRVSDSYNEAWTRFVENIKLGKLSDLQQAGVKTYLFRIGEFVWYEWLRKKNQQKLSQTFSIDSESNAGYVGILSEEKVMAIKNALAKLSPSCRELLRLAFYEDLSAQEIVERLHLANTNVVKTQKCRCVGYLRDVFGDDLRTYFFHE